MSDAHGATLYSTLDQSRFFHVPVDVVVPEGGLPVRTLSGGRRDLDADALAPYEVDEARAKQIVQQQLGAFMEFASQAVGQLQGLAARFQQARDDLQAAAGSERQDARRANLADALQIDPDKVDDPAQVMRGLNTIMERVQARMADPEQLKKAGVRDEIREDMQKLGSAATNQAVGDAEGAVEDARSALLEIFGSDETRQALREATEELKRVRGEMQQAGVVAPSAGPGTDAESPTGNRPDPDQEAPPPETGPDDD